MDAKRQEAPERRVADKAPQPPAVLAETEGEWAEMPPPELQPQFRCILRGLGSVVRRPAQPHAPDGTGQ